MEFSTAFAISTASGSVTKTRFFKWGTFYDADGAPIPGASSHHRSGIATALMKGPVYACLDKADAATRAAMRKAQPNFFLPLDRAGIDPFTQRFPIKLRYEGTVRGTGGLRITDATCATSVPGLYAAGDAATRELICGGFTGGGSHNAAWAMSSGFWAGEAAADHSRQLGIGVERRGARPVGGAALDDGDARPFDPATVIGGVQAEVFPYDKNYFRTGDGLAGSLRKLDGLWAALRQADAADAANVVRAREAAAMTATARWMYRSALARTETRGMHKRTDHPTQTTEQHHYLTVGGLDEVWIQPRPAPIRIEQELPA